MKSLTAKFIFFIILPVTLILSVLSLTSYLMAHRLLIDQMKKSGQNFLRASAEQISSRIIQVQSTLKLLAITENLETLDETVSLEDYKGKWLILFFYPYDFSHVCPTEILALSNKYEEFQTLNTEILGVYLCNCPGLTLYAPKKITNDPFWCKCLRSRISRLICAIARAKSV